MANDTKDWFVGERSEALASLLLRSRNDIQIRDESSANGGIDFLVDVNREDSPWSMLFVVQVKGTTSADYKAWFEGAKRFVELHEKNNPILPTCIFLFNVRDRQAFYAWVVEPLVEQDKPATLQVVPPSDFHELDQPAVDGIVNRVREWYAAYRKQLIPKEA